ncbi:MAG TPA: cobalamin-dependent protein [Planctomycetota bacterium]|nr:cobalamin-dependent protein [Planctomycetota bacterium]
MSTTLASQILQSSADGIAGLAAARLFELVSVDAVDDFAAWKQHLRTQVLQLAAALQAQDATAFAENITWVHEAFRSRNISTEVLGAALQSLEETARESLPTTLGEVLGPYVDAARTRLVAGSQPTPSFLDPKHSSGALAGLYLEALRSGDEATATKLLFQAAKPDQLGIRTVMEEVLSPAMREIGRLWHNGQATVAEEHYVTQVTTKVLAQLLAQAPHAPQRGKTALLAGVAGNAHSFGLQVVAGHFELAGWRTICLGSDTPSASVAEAAVALGAHVVLLGATLGTQLAETQATLAAVRVLCPGAKIVVGGAACSRDQSAWERLGADGFAGNGSEAVQVAESLIG